MSDSFPWLSHRTLAEVDETERLRFRRMGGWHVRRPNEAPKFIAEVRLAALESRAVEPDGLLPPSA